MAAGAIGMTKALHRTGKYKHFCYVLMQKKTFTTALIYPDSSPACWHNCGNNVFLVHIWWSCPGIPKFWNNINLFISTLTQTHLALSLQLALLGVGREDWPLNSMLSLHILIAARLTFAQKWKSALFPLFQNTL